MKNLLLVAFFALMNLAQSSAASGIFQTYAIVNFGTGNTYLAGGANADGAPSFNGTDFGTPTTLTLNGGEVKTFKNGGSDVFGATIFYRVYKQGDTPGAFTDINLPFAENLPNGDDQRWDETSAGVDILAQATAGNGDYFLEVYWFSDNSDGGSFDSNGGSNYMASFTVNVLPVDLTSFTAKTENNTVNLAWTTALEINNDYFQIERKTAAEDWTAIGKVNGNGNSDTENRYAFADKNPANGVNFYRLKQTDYDGQYEYSFTVKAEIREPQILNVFPNPTAGSMSLDLPRDFTAGEVKIYDTTGKIVFTQKVNADTNLNLDAFTPGIYFARLFDENGRKAAESKIRKL